MTKKRSITLRIHLIKQTLKNYQPTKLNVRTSRLQTGKDNQEIYLNRNSESGPARDDSHPVGAESF